MTPDDIRKLAERWDSLAPLMHTPEVLRACADVVEYGKEVDTYSPVRAFKGCQKLIEALHKLEAIKP